MKNLMYSALMFMILFSSCNNTSVKFLEKKDKIDVLINGKYFTSYLFGGFHYNKIEGNTGIGGFDHGFVAKPVLYPIESPSGITITRGYPLNKIQGESMDHPGHLGILFAFRFNEKDEFWDNSSDKCQIKHIKVLEIKNGKNEGMLKTLSNWINPEGKVLLEERRDMRFKSINNGYLIDFDITLISKDSIVTFKDHRCGLLQIRVADWLRETVESGWMKSRIPNATGTATYRSSNGDINEQGIFGKRANWVCLEGNKDGRDVGVAIFDHPESFNHPTHWMVRSYGLIAANPLGQGEFEEIRKVENPKCLNLSLKSGEKVNFRYQVIIYDGKKEDKELENIYKLFCQ